MTRKNKIVIIILAAALIFFLFPKKNGTWLVSSEEDFYCKCFGYQYISGGPIKLTTYGWMADKPGNSLCFGIPYSCGNAGYDNYWGQ
jgi:hypothetical protein